jgi:hypothetical protein
LGVTIAISPVVARRRRMSILVSLPRPAIEARMVLDYACGFKEFLRRIMDCAMRNKSYAIASLVIPAKAGTQSGEQMHSFVALGSRLHRNDG